jgi:hypothetical protein
MNQIFSLESTIKSISQSNKIFRTFRSPEQQIFFQLRIEDY